MIKFKNVKLRNFLSYGEKETVFSLEEEGTTLILGENRDASVDTKANNGSGKTASAQAVVFALYGRGLDKLRADEFVNITNGRRLEVTLEFEKNGKTYQISRRRKPSGLDLFLIGDDGEKESLTLDSMSNTDAMIEELIGMPYEVFMMSFFLTPHNTSFMAMSGPEQRSLIESMLSLDVLAKRAESLKDIRKELEVDLKLAEREVELAVSSNDRTNANLERLQRLSDEWEDDHTKTITALKEELVEANRVDIEGIEAAWESYVAEKEKIASLNDRLSDLREQLSEVNSSIQASESEQREVSRSLDDLVSAEKNFAEWDEKNQNEIALLEKTLSEGGLVTPDVIKALEEKISAVEDRIVVEKDYSTAEAKAVRLEKASSNLEEELEVLKSGKCFTCNQPHFDEELTNKKELELRDIQESMVELISDMEKMVVKIESLPDDDINVLKEELRVINRKNSSLMETEAKLKVVKGGVNPYKAILEGFEVEGITRQGLGKKIKEMASSLSLLDETKNRILAEISEVKEAQSAGATKPEILEEYGIEAKSQIKELSGISAVIEEDIAKEEGKKNPYVDEIRVAKEALLDVSELEDRVDDLKKDITHCQYLVRLLTDNKSFVRKNIVDRYIPMVNKKIVEYTEILGLLHIPSINNDLSTDIEYMNKSISYYNLSQGERLRTNLSVSLAFRHLMKSLGNDTNLLVIDEFFDSGGDAVFLNKAFYLTQSQAETVLMISHREEFKEIVTRHMTIVKENGFSFVE